MKKLLIYLKTYRKEACLAPIFKMLEAVFELFVPLVISERRYGIAAEDRILSSHGTAAFTACRNRSCNGNYSAVVFAERQQALQRKLQVLMEHIQAFIQTTLLVHQR
ncbi:MAG: hypothetical protein ACLRZ6_06375 [Lachnospiraceae bacterium]